MTTLYETSYRFEHDPALEALIRENVRAGPSSIQAVIDACSSAGFDGRAAATEIAILVIDKVFRPTVPTDRLSGSTVVELMQGNLS